MFVYVVLLIQEPDRKTYSCYYTCEVFATREAADNFVSDLDWDDYDEVMVEKKKVQGS